MLDPTKLADWQIAELSEANMRTPQQLADALGLLPEELIPFGRQIARVDQMAIRKRLANAPKGKYIDVTAITPTPLGEGKTTTTIGLIEGLALRGNRVSGAIRQPSGGPTFNIKGSAAGGGLAQCIPLTTFSMGLTGDIDKITNAHNLCMVALTSRMQHERNYDDAQLAKRNLKRLDIDPNRVQMKWVIDFCAQALRNITIGQGGKMDGVTMDSGFAITVSSELMAILAIATFSFQSCGYSFSSDYEVEYGFLIDGEITLDNMNAAIVFYPELFEAMEKEFEALPHFTKTGP
ncbi:MAG: formate--tetrahydrofolate ligase, partial [Lentisphaeria bacterium]|nr:formate--tetrahydrofolate ligase [Lentisphaeria bacterium]